MPSNNKVIHIATIREDECIGCSKCIPACPVDAIIGAPRLMHTVFADECIGCKLCIEPCPVDCIDIKTLPLPEPSVRIQRAALARQRHLDHKNRSRKIAIHTPAAVDRKTEIAAAVERMKQLKNHERTKTFSAV